MTRPLDHQADLAEAVAHLLRCDPRLHPVAERAGMPVLRRREPGFAGLARIVVGQQLSVAAAGAVWNRVAAALDPFDPASLLRTPDDELGRLGLSRAKVRSLKAVAAEIADARLDLDRLATMPADEARAVLVALRGIGPWTADVYLLFCLGHADAWPAGDLAVQESLRVGLGLPHRPGPKETVALAEPWRPFRGAAAHLWWEHYRAIRSRDGIGLSPPAGTLDRARAPKT